MKIKTLKLSEIKPYPNNPRNNEKAVKHVAESIKRYGYVQPITVDPENVIITGHTRYFALKDLKFEKIDVIVLDLPESEAREYRLVDNRVHEYTSWDVEKLKQELREVGDSLKPFFDDWDYDNMISEDMGKFAKDISQGDIEKSENHVEKSQEEKEEYFECKCPKCERVLTIKK